MAKIRNLIRITRVTLLLALLGATFLLYRWSKSADPRFYRFVETPTGQVLAQTFGWHDSRVKQYDKNKPYDEWTQQEKNIYKTLQARLREDAPTHRLHMDNGKYMEGTLISTGPDYIEFRETYGNSGSLSARVQRARVQWVEEVQPELPKISYSDIRLQLEFPAMQLYRRPPYTIVTDETFFHVERSVRVLQQLHDQFMEYFAPLFTRNRKEDDIQLAFFSNETSFRHYQRKYAPQMVDCLGFYSPALDRFMVFNEKRSDLMREISTDINEQSKEYKANAASDRQRYRIELLKRRSQRTLQHEAEQRTFTTLRHEGAHQLLFTYGVHSSFRIENEWLIEGLAVFCEGEDVGMVLPRRLSALESKLNKNQHIPLDDLVNYRERGGFMIFDNPNEIELAYHESWALVHFLMQGENRNRFFEFIRYLRDPKHLEECMETPQFDLLCHFMQMEPQEMKQAWASYVRSL